MAVSHNEKSNFQIDAGALWQPTSLVRRLIVMELL
jgi:hypothetical protein